MRLLSILVLLFLAGCGVTYSTGGDDVRGTGSLFAGNADRDSTDEISFHLDVKEMSPVMLGTTRAGATYGIAVTNHTSEPLKLVRIGLQSYGSDAAEMVPLTAKTFDTTIAPGEKVELEMLGDFYINDTDVGLAAPMVLRATLYLEQGDAKRREYFTRRVGRGSLAVGQTP